MEKIIMLLGGIAIGYWYRSKTIVCNKCGPSDDEVARRNLDKVMALLARDSELTNDEIQKALGISDRTVVRYMDKLEKEGKVEQVGDIGRGVIYRKKN